MYPTETLKTPYDYDPQSENASIGINSILVGGCLWQETYRGWTLEAYKTNLGGAIRGIKYKPMIDFIIYSSDCLSALAEAEARIDQELEGTFDDMPF
jgi:hypothetical protein